MHTRVQVAALLAVPKKRVSEKPYDFPLAGEKQEIDIVSEDGREKFILSVYKARTGNNCVFQLRHEDDTILTRLATGKPHTNPGAPAPLPELEAYAGKCIAGPHLHIYTDGYDVQWVVPAPVDTFPNIDDLYKTLDDFFFYCNIVEPPIVQGGLLP